MKLGEKDASGRRRPVSSGKIVEIEADTVISAVGQQIDSDLLRKNKIESDSKGFSKVNKACETNINNVYVTGDMKEGPSTIVKAIADGKAVSKDILLKEGLSNDFDKKVFTANEKETYNKKGILKASDCLEKESERCLSCNKVCEICVDVCPNRANIVVNVDEGFQSSHQIIHLDGMCNECGNCGIFCPYKGNPYKDKTTVFWSKEDFEDSTNKGFLIIDKDKGICKVRKENAEVVDYTVGELNVISNEMENMIKTFINKYSYMS